MKGLLNILLFGNSFFREFPAISISENAIDEMVVLEESGSKQSDVSKTHWLLSLEPMVFGIWFEANSNGQKKSNCKLHFKKADKVLAILKLNFINTITEKEGSLLLFEVSKSEIFYASHFKAKLVYWLYYKKEKLSFGQFRNLAAAFSYPRKVRLVSFKKEDYFNIFPMDLVGEIAGTNRFVFGLRHTNSTLGKIIENKKIAVTEFPAQFKNEIYQLAKHHSDNPLNIEALPFTVKQTALYKFPIPGFAIKYHEIEVMETQNLGSHMLLWGKAVNSVSMDENEENLYHVHYLAYLDQENKYVLA
jgi:hypothetical protein